MSEWFTDDFKRSRVAFAKFNVKLDSPSKDGYLRRLSFRNGGQIFFTADALPLNSATARSLAHDKLATYQVLEEMDIVVPNGFAFFASEFRQRETHVESHLLFERLPNDLLRRFPKIADKNLKMIVKPGQESRGYMVSVCKTFFEIMLCARDILTVCHYGLVQEYVEGPEYRVVILNDKPIVVYKKSSSRHEKHGKIKAKHSGQDILEINSPVRGDEGVLCPIPEVPQEIITIARRANGALGLRYSGIDICLPGNESPAVVLEVNSNPGFDALENDSNFDAQKVADEIARAVLELYASSRLKHYDRVSGVSNKL